jgi:Spy/CpxP family protein refolding chaperone
MSRWIALGLALGIVGVAGGAAFARQAQSHSPVPQAQLSDAQASSQDPMDHSQHSHYAGRETSEIPALTDDEIAELRAGEGMGTALPAELNHYPGPRHVLDMADDLALTAEQRARTEEIFTAMQQQAQDLGNRIIDAERQLNMRFQHGHIDADVLREQTATIATLYGELRATHLGAHLQMKELLSAEQVARYDELRGYMPH